MAPKRGGLPINKKEIPALRKTGISFCVCTLLYLALSTVCHAITLSVEGEQIDYETNATGVIASQNVEIRYGEHLIKTSYTAFDIASQNIRIPSHFVYQHQQTQVSGSAMAYSFKTHDGHIQNIQAQVEKTKITGTSLDINNVRLEMNDLTFTTCDKPTPDYEVHAELVHFYPQVGFMVAFNNTLYTRFLPFPLWIPTYIYGSRSYSIIGSSSAIPEIGANNREGLYVKHRFGYFFDEHSTGTLDLGWYIERGGFLYGFTHLQETSDMSELHLEAHMVGFDGFEGLAAYYTDLLFTDTSDEGEPDSPSEGQAFLSILQEFKSSTSKVMSRLHTGVAHRQLINDSRVTQLPFIKLVLNETVLFDDWKLSGDLGWADVKEETPKYTFHEEHNTHTQISLGKMYALAPSTNFGTDVFSYMNWYESGQSWQRLFASFYLDFKLADLQPRLFYIKKIMNPYGNSPFEYEQKYATVSDEIGARVTFPLLGLEWGYEAFYDLDRKELRTQNLTTSFLFDCWKLSIQTNTIAGTFSFGVELL